MGRIFRRGGACRHSRWPCRRDLVLRRSCGSRAERAGTRAGLAGVVRGSGRQGALRSLVALERRRRQRRWAESKSLLACSAPPPRVYVDFLPHVRPHAGVGLHPPAVPGGVLPYVRPRLVFLMPPLNVTCGPCGVLPCMRDGLPRAGRWNGGERDAPAPPVESFCAVLDLWAGGGCERDAPAPPAIRPSTPSS